MCGTVLSQLAELTRNRNCQSIKALLQSLPTQKDKAFEGFIAELYRGNGWIAVVKGGRGDESGDVLLSHPRSPNVVSWVVQCKNQVRPLTYDDTRIELIKFEEKGTGRYKCTQFRIVAVNGFVSEARKLGEFNLLLNDWSYVVSLIESYDPGNIREPSIDLYPHNQATFDEVLHRWHDSLRVAVVQPTGTGKSFLIAKVMSLPSFFEKRTIILAPSWPILDHLRRQIPWASSQTTFMTYAGACDLSEAEAFGLSPALVVLDELHRCGAEEWGRGIARILSCNPTAHVVGATATPIRYLDNCRDMAQELFGGQIAGRLTLARAIAKRILPMPRYVCALYTLNEEVGSLTERIERSRLDTHAKRELTRHVEGVRIDWERSCGAPKVLAKHINDDLGKFIVFCRDKAHLDAMEDEVRGWFQKALGKPRKSYRVVSGDPESERNLEDFRRASDKRKVHLLFCIDMLNEGVHIEDVSGVILLRPTASPIVFYQQIGRCIQVGVQHTPVIFDLVNNFRSIRATDFRVDLERAEEEERLRREACGLPNRSVAITIADETQDMVQLLEAIEERISPKELACRRTEAFCRRYRSLRKLPRQKSRNRQEATDGSWLGQMRQAKQGNGARKFYVEMDKIAASYNMAGLFDALTPEQRKNRSVRRTHRLCKALLDGQVSAKMVTWRNYVKRLKKHSLAGRTVVGYYPDMEEVVASYGLSGVFDTSDFQSIALDRVNRLLEWVRTHGRSPKKNSTDAEERQYAIAVSQLRMAKQGRGKYQFLPEMDELAAKAGLPWLFDDNKTRLLNRTKAFCEKYKGHRLPTVRAADPIEKKDASWLVSQRMRKAGKGTGFHYSDLDDIAGDYGMPRLFDTRPDVSFDHAQRWTRKYFAEHLEYPTQRSGAIAYAQEEGFDTMSWQTVFAKFPKADVMKSIRPAFSPDLVRRWDEIERSQGRKTLHKMSTSLVEAAKRDGYLMAASAINSRLETEFKISLAQLLRPSTQSQATFTLELAEKIVLQEYQRTHSWPTVNTSCIESAETYGYPKVSGNALNKRLRKLRSSLREITQRLRQRCQSEDTQGH